MNPMPQNRISRRKFLEGSLKGVAGGLAFPLIVPRHVLGGPGQTPPSEALTRAVVGVGGRGSGFVEKNSPGGKYRTLAVCDVDKKRLARAVEAGGVGERVRSRRESRLAARFALGLHRAGLDLVAGLHAESPQQSLHVHAEAVVLNLEAMPRRVLPLDAVTDIRLSVRLQ